MIRWIPSFELFGHYSRIIQSNIAAIEDPVNWGALGNSGKTVVGTLDGPNRCISKSSSVAGQLRKATGTGAGIEIAHDHSRIRRGKKI